MAMLYMIHMTSMFSSARKIDFKKSYKKQYMLLKML